MNKSGDWRQVQETWKLLSAKMCWNLYKSISGNIMFNLVILAFINLAFLFFFKKQMFYFFYAQPFSLCTFAFFKWWVCNDICWCWVRHFLHRYLIFWPVLITFMLHMGRFSDGTSSGLSFQPVAVMKRTLQMVGFMERFFLPTMWIHCFKIGFLLSGNLKYERLVSLVKWLAQPGTPQKCTILSQLFK